jgi:hypothetical protein
MSHNEPIAWAVLLADGDRIYDVYAIEEEAKAIDEVVTGNHGIIPLYRSPTLADAEREAISRVYDLLCDRARELQSATRLDEARPLIQWAKTLQGLWERLSPDRPEAIAAGDTATPPEPAIPPAWLSRPYWVDPAGGHRYGFPRLYDPATDGDMTAWLIANGYPESLAMQELACTFTACTDSGGK